MLRLRRAFLIACALAAVAASGLLFFLGDTRGSAAAAIVTASVMTFLGVRGSDPSLPRRHWLGLGLLGSALVVLGFPIGVVTGSLILLFVLQLLLTVIVARRVGRITLERLDHAVVMLGAEQLVDQFCAEGFYVLGAYRFQTGGNPVVLTVMIGAQRDRLAVVTDKVWQIASRFGSRSLVTTNSAVAPLPADVLRQLVSAGRPADLVHAHDTALALLDDHSHRPDRFASDTEALHAVREMEERALAFINKVALRTAWHIQTASASQTGVLTNDAHSRSRINAWVGA
jgi:hypothetical protein